MKILLDPNIAVLIKDMSDAECAEILRCIFEYPNRDCEIGLWKYIKIGARAVYPKEAVQEYEQARIFAGCGKRIQIKGAEDDK